MASGDLLGKIKIWSDLDAERPRLINTIKVNGSVNGMVLLEDKRLAVATSRGKIKLLLRSNILAPDNPIFNFNGSEPLINDNGHDENEQNDPNARAKNCPCCTIS